ESVALRPQRAIHATAHRPRLHFDPLQRDFYGTSTMVTTIPETLDLIDEVGEPNVGVLFDVYHLWDTDDVFEHTRRHARRFGPSVHICDWREETRNDFDRALPGEGIMDLSALFAALEDGGFAGWYDHQLL